LKNTQIENFTKIRPVGAKLFLADSWTDRWTDRHDKANSLFSLFENMPKKQSGPVTVLAESQTGDVCAPCAHCSEIYTGLHIILSNIGLCKVQVVPVHALKLLSGAKEQLHSF